MKKHLSVLFLAVRGALCPVLAVLGLMAAAETLAFYLALRGNAGRSLAFVWDASFIPFVAGAALCAICVLLLRVGSGATQGSTLCRLRVRERTVTLWWWGSAALCLFLVWAVQSGLAFLFSAFYVSVADAALVNPQTIVLAFYQVPFLHGLVPLADGALWARNVFLLLTLSLCAGRAPGLLRQGKKPVALIVFLAITLVTFSAKMGRTTGTILLCCAAAMTLFAQFCALFAKEEEV